MTHRQIMEAFTGLLLALLVAMLSSTIVSNALPTILADLNGSQSQYTWVVTATLLTSTATTPIWGKLSDLFSKKLLYQLAIVIFTIGSVLGGISQSMPELIGYRALQGIGLGGLQALIQVVIAAMIPPRDRGRYSGYIGATFAVATVSGPLVGGLIVDSPLGWRWCFWVCVPIAIAAFIVLGRTLKLPVVKRDVKIDWLGATLLVGGVTLLLIWISSAGKSFGWASLSTVFYLGGALVMLALAVFVESRVSEPVVPLRLFRNRTITMSVIGTLAVGTAMFGGSVFLGQYYQISRGFSPTHAGLMTLPMVLGLFVSSTASGQVVSRTGKAKPFMLGGSVVLLVGLALLSTVDHTTNLTLMGVYLALMGIGVGCLMQNLVLVVQNTVSMRDMGSASSMVMFFRTLGGSAGVSALGAVLATQVSNHIAESLTKLGISGAGATSGGGGTMNLQALPAPLQEIVRAAYGDGTGTIFLIAAVISVITLISVIFLKEVPLRTTLDTEDLDADEPEEAPVVATAAAATAQAVPARPSAMPVHASYLPGPLPAGSGNTSHVHGTVTGSAGEPITGAAITLTDTTGRQVDRVRSDGDGRFQLVAPSGGNYVLITSAGQFQPNASMIVLNGGPVRHDVAMTTAGGVSGRVQDAAGHAVPGATLVLTNQHGDVVASGLSGGDGWYRFADLLGGQYAVTVTAAGYRPLATQLTVVDGESAELNMALTATSRLGGVIRSGRFGHPVRDARVTLVNAAGEVVAATHTDEEGRYHFPDLADGDYTLIASGYTPVVSELAIAGGTEVGRDLELGHRS
jgi:EmrB/QacA subfamily drug resistance transporter